MEIGIERIPMLELKKAEKYTWLKETNYQIK